MFTPNISAELTGAHLDEVIDMSAAEFHENNAGDMSAIAQHLPEPATSLTLDQETVSKSGEDGLKALATAYARTSA